MTRPDPSRWARIVAPALPLLVAVVIYHGWFMPGFITYGDWLFLPFSRLLDYWPVPSLWNATRDLGGMDTLGGPLYPQLCLHGLLALFGVDDRWTERLVFAFPALFVGCIGGYVFTYGLFRSRLAAVVTAIFTVTNSYIVLIYGGGQLTVGVAYAFIPLILWSSRAGFCSGERFRYVLTALLLAIQATYDLRSTYITVWLLILYAPFLIADRLRAFGVRTITARLALQAAACAAIIPLVHAHWILPSLLVKAAALPQGYAGAAAALISTVGLQNAVALSHPFWPLDDPSRLKPFDPLFFLIALLVFAPLLRRRLSLDLLYLCAVSVLAIFLVKSNNPPAGQVYEWLFLHFPGFSLFRESSKFYQPLMVSAGALLGFVAMDGARLLKRHMRSLMGRVRVPAFVRPACYLPSGAWAILCAAAALYPATPVVSGALAQSFVPRQMPPEYARLNAMIDGQQEYFRTLWWPAYERFGTYSQRHPAIEGGGNAVTAQALQALSVKYVIVPYDPLHDIFNADIGPGSQEAAVADARRVLKGFRAMTIGRLHVFVNPRFLPEVYVPARVTVQRPQATVFQLPPNLIEAGAGAGPMASAATVQSTYSAPIDPRRFTYSATARSMPRIVVRRADASRIDVDVSGAERPFLALFLQSLDPHWQAYIFPRGASPGWWALRHAQAIPRRYHMMGDGYANAWWIDRTGSFTLVLTYWPQDLVNVGLAISWLTILSCTAYTIVAARRRNRRGWATRPAPVDTSTGTMAGVEKYRNAAIPL